MGRWRAAGATTAPTCTALLAPTAQPGGRAGHGPDSIGGVPGMGGSTYSGAGAVGAVSGGIAGSLSGRTSSSGSYGATVSGKPGHGPDSVGGVPPIIIDLDGDGVELVSLANSTAFFDIDKDGFRENMGWAGADDGFLVMDLNGDGDVQAGEIAFAGQTRADDTDMECLRAHDFNDDGKFSAADAKWSKARVWQDQDQDGAVDAGEMRTLGQASLTSIGLVSNGREQTVAGNTIAGLSKATFADGRTSVHRSKIVGTWPTHAGRQNVHTELIICVDIGCIRCLCFCVAQRQRGFVR